MVNNAEELKALIDDYRAMVKRAEEIAQAWHFNAEKIGYDGDWLEIYGQEHYRGYHSNEVHSIPISWMFMDPKQLDKAKEEKARADKIARQEWEKQKAEREAAEAKAKDRAEYERLRPEAKNKAVYERLRAKYGN